MCFWSKIGKFLGNLIINKGIEANLDWIGAIDGMTSLENKI